MYLTHHCSRMISTEITLNLCHSDSPRPVSHSRPRLAGKRCTLDRSFLPIVNFYFCHRRIEHLNVFVPVYIICIAAKRRDKADSEMWKLRLIRFFRAFFFYSCVKKIRRYIEVLKGDKKLERLATWAISSNWFYRCVFSRILAATKLKYIFTLRLRKFRYNHFYVKSVCHIIK